MFVTSSETLSENIGQSETKEILNYLQSLSESFVCDLPRLTDINNASKLIQPFLKRPIKGVVIIGGYDVVPTVQLDVLTEQQRRDLFKEGFNSTKDKDNFIVYNDDIFGDIDGDLYPEFPVSRIPDGRKAQVIMNALKAPSFSIGRKFGIRNIARPFAEICYQNVPGPIHDINITEHFRPDDIQEDIAQGAVYYMLHGKDLDGTRFLGETTGGVGIEAIRIDNIPKEVNGSIVFAGCCWGALTVLPIAMNKTQETKFRPRTPEESIALSYIERGANAFVGCTGSHYSPDDPPLDYYGKPIHDTFWKEIAAGNGASMALFKAKKEYASQMPHGNYDAFSKAVELKLLRAFTCLGIGW